MPTKTKINLAHIDYRQPPIRHDHWEPCKNKDGITALISIYLLTQQQMPTPVNTHTFVLPASLSFNHGLVAKAV